MANPSWSPTKCRVECESCGSSEFGDGHDGFFYCLSCGSQSQEIIDTGFAEEDIFGDGQGAGALYSVFRHRSKPQSQTPGPPTSLISKADHLRGLSQSIAASRVKKEEKEEEKKRPYAFDDESSEPRDFGVGQCPDWEVVASGIRLRYVQGLQVMLQLQCEALVEKFGVSPITCGLSGTIWLQHVAASKVFDAGWAQKVISESEEAAASQLKNQGTEDEKVSKNIKYRYRWEPHTKYGQRAIYLWFRALRKKLPVYSTLAILFLVCHIGREAILPTDIYDWASEGKLPFLNAFDSVEKYIGRASVSSPLSSRFLFRPIRVVGAWHLEAVAGSIAHNIGLRLPSVNFYAIASRYLNDLSLPVDKILPHACRVYEWSMPAELWLSSNASRLPTRVCVMSILIVTIRILYNMHGQGTWEKSVSDFCNSMTKNDGVDANSFFLSLDEARKCAENKDAEFDAKELLCTLEVKSNQISTLHDYSSDLRSYLIYCKDVLFAGMTTSLNEETLIERLWDIYNMEEDKDLLGMKNESLFSNGKSCSKRAPNTTLFDSMEPQDSESDQHKKRKMTADDTATAQKASKVASLEEMKLKMEDDGFQYLPPRVQKARGYLHYKRKKVDGELVYVAHADYYILLKTCANLAKVDIRIMHLGVLNFERRLAWIEQRIDSSMDTFSEISSQQHGQG